MAKPNVISKNELIRSAKKCLVKNGIEKFTLRAVAETAGVTQGTVYYHFRTKEQLLLDIVKDICDSSWDELSKSDGNIIKQAIETAKSRCSHDSFFHKLFLTLVVSGFHNDKIREQLEGIILQENKALAENLLKIWPSSPIKGISLDTWAIILNAVVDGIALQALLSKNFPVEKTYAELEKLFIALSGLQEVENK
ncbi:MAG: TetR/AcrR family transcriptional regulator [Bacillaceae bacterium]|jgi:AcrR family transcriptional regulator|uniref:TetR family transcriptional regulator n=2 Tax=Aeribacillus TaxID=1055323 RepID=A0A165XEQ2_9BACI|nr:MULTISPECIES: TetR/AcrR family transcriptional regulator [Aeribacillus]REJ11650.1 MAG: TetR/AcrR family transcriptional regulator [Bacillaceae bacterium]KZM56117.1 TetR family transcriptional regulator [Aeribacillus pallidus]KZN95943.1 TetR family transcriptional regulator [Aeribacillus pallidus]MDR9794626.1 TetR/AcrR family transcriptional regulator [Aeribacillus pallidus]MDR9797130.1 TetR/AcrR family transcriptional regulator [Aeribacillus pallidus]